MIDIKTFNTFAAMRGTDKLTHGYVEHYSRYLPAKCDSLLEIGVFKGASLKLWRDLYPKADIACFDLFLDPLNISKEEVEAMGFRAYQGNQESSEDLAKIDGEFDVIIEDGSHRSDHQITTLVDLWPKVKRGGVYVVEDLHTCKEEFYWGNTFVKEFEHTLLYKLRHPNSPDDFWSQFSDVTSIKLYDDKIAFIFKG